MNGTSTLQIATQLHDQARRLSSTRENMARTFKGLEKLIARMKWKSSMENHFAALNKVGLTPEAKGDYETFLKNVEGDEDKYITRLNEIYLEFGISYRSIIGVSNALTTSGKDLLTLAQPELSKLVDKEMRDGKGVTLSGLSQDSTKADPYQAQNAADKAEAAASITNEKAPEAPNLAGPTL